MKLSLLLFEFLNVDIFQKLHNLHVLHLASFFWNCAQIFKNLSEIRLVRNFYQYLSNESNHQNWFSHSIILGENSNVPFMLESVLGMSNRNEVEKPT